MLVQIDEGHKKAILSQIAACNYRKKYITKKKKNTISKIFQSFCQKLF